MIFGTAQGTSPQNYIAQVLPATKPKAKRGRGVEGIGCLGDPTAEVAFDSPMRHVLEG